MNLRHGQLWQRLGLAVLSGILVASLAPATAAAPVTGQEISDDAGSFSGDVSSVGTGDVVSDVAQGSDVSDGVDASAGDSASEAAASNEGKGATFAPTPIQEPPDLPAFMSSQPRARMQFCSNPRAYLA